MGKLIYSKKSFDFPWADLWCLYHCRFHLLFLHLQRHLRTSSSTTFSSSNLFVEKGKKKTTKNNEGCMSNQVPCCKWAPFKHFSQSSRKEKEKQSEHLGFKSVASFPYLNTTRLACYSWIFCSNTLSFQHRCHIRDPTISNRIYRSIHCSCQRLQL